VKEFVLLPARAFVGTDEFDEFDIKKIYQIAQAAFGRDFVRMQIDGVVVKVESSYLKSRGPDFTRPPHPKCNRFKARLDELYGRGISSKLDEIRMKPDLTPLQPTFTLK